jgi:hypothetical protein
MRNYIESEVRTAVTQSLSYSDVFRKFGLEVNGGSYTWLKNLIAKFDIDVSHFLSRKELALKALDIAKDVNIKDYSIIDDISCGKRLTTEKLRRFMLSKNKREECFDCNLTEWQGEKLRLDIDHLDGNCTNNHISNLNFLCPNCHRLKTIAYVESPLRFKSKPKSTNLKQHKERKIKYCLDCNCEIAKESVKCRSCAKKNKNFKIEWPTDYELQAMILERPVSQIAKSLGVSDVAIHKRCKIRNIIK